MKEGKSFSISQEEILIAYKKVKENKGVGGIDKVNFEDYEINLKNNLYKLWNRMSSGSYFPKPVKGVEIPKKNGKVRLLGIPTIEDRVAQMAIRNRIEQDLEKVFLEDSYGYRPNKSALEAIGKTRERCFKMPWLVEFDIVGLFDNISHEKLMKILKYHIKERWIILYVKRTLCVPMKMPNGNMKERNAGTPQGGVISPVLANIFLHHAFDKWISKYQNCKWARYADDGVVHCYSENHAKNMMEKLDKRMKECGLEIHPEKSKIVYCRNSKCNYDIKSFDFLGYTFRNRSCKNKNGKIFTSFTPAVSNSAGKSFRSKIKDSITRINTTSIEKLAEILNLIIRGWMNYFTKYNPSHAFRQGINYINLTLIRWLRKTRKRVRNGLRKAQNLLNIIFKRKPLLFYHWKLGYIPVK